MRKITILFAIILSAQLLSAQTIKIETNFPEQIEKKKEYTVDVIITKSDISAFAQYKQQLPAGFSAKNVNSQTANFSYKNQVLEYCWEKLPSDTTITISYVIVADTLVNNFELQGIFSYLINNKRGVTNTEMQKYDINEQGNIAILSGKSIKNTVNDKNTKIEENIFDFFQEE